MLIRRLDKLLKVCLPCPCYFVVHFFHRFMAVWFEVQAILFELGVLSLHSRCPSCYGRHVLT